MRLRRGSRDLRCARDFAPSEVAISAGALYGCPWSTVDKRYHRPCMSSSTRVYPSHALTRSFKGREFFLSDPLSMSYRYPGSCSAAAIVSPDPVSPPHFARFPLLELLSPAEMCGRRVSRVGVMYGPRCLAFGAGKPWRRAPAVGLLTAAAVGARRPRRVWRGVAPAL